MRALGKELSIKDLTELVAKAIGYTGEILWDTSKPNGTPRKLLDVSKAAPWDGPTGRNWRKASVWLTMIS